MKTYPIIELFYSLKGEGMYTGTPMHFIRLAGCNLSCSFCDTPSMKNYDYTKEEIVEQIEQYDSDCHRIVITGGEPNIHDLHELIQFLQDNYYTVHMETNGTETKYVHDNIKNVDFLTVSPKSTLNLCQHALDQCNEIKFVYDGSKQYEDMIWEIEKRLLINEPKKFILPIAEAYNNGEGRYKLIHDNISSSIRFCKDHPEFSLCLQVHKILMIP